MAHALPTPPGHRRARAIAAVAVVVVLALVVVGLLVRNRTHNTGSGPTSTTTAVAATTTAPSTTTTAPATTAAPTTTSPVPATSTSAAPTTTTPTSTPRTSATTTPPAVRKVDLVVMNNTARNGLASTARARFEAKGWKVSDVANFTGGVISTCAYYDPSNSANKRAAEALRAQFPAIKRIKPRFSRLPSAPVVVILTSDYR